MLCIHAPQVSVNLARRVSLDRANIWVCTGLVFRWSTLSAIPMYIGPTLSAATEKQLRGSEQQHTCKTEKQLQPH